MIYSIQTILYLTAITYLSTLPVLAQTLPEDKSQTSQFHHFHKHLKNKDNVPGNIDTADGTTNPSVSETNNTQKNFSLSGNNLNLGGSNEQVKSLVPLKEIITTKVQTTIDQNEVTLGHLKGLMIKVTNNTDRPILFHGDQSVAVNGKEHYTCVPLSELDNLVVPKRNIMKTTMKATGAAVTLGWMPTLRDAKISSGPITGRYEWDEARRENEISLFSKRILWPGDDCAGIVYFKTKNLPKGTVLTIPVESRFNSKDCASLTIAY